MTALLACPCSHPQSAGRTSPCPRRSWRVSLTSYPSSAPWSCPLFYNPPSSYLSKAVRPTAKYLASSSQQRFVERSGNGPCVRSRATTAMMDVTGRPLLLPRPPTTSAQCFQKCYLVCIYRAWSLFLILSTCCSTVHFADTRPHSPTTLAYESIIHRSATSNIHSIYRENRHTPTCAYPHLSFPICQLGSNDIALSHCVSTYSGASLNCPQRTTGPIKSLITSSTCTKPATRSATVAPTQLILTTNHCERRYDYHPIRCHPSVVIRCLSVHRSIGIKWRPTANPLPTRFTPLPTDEPLVRLFTGIYIYILQTNYT